MNPSTMIERLRKVEEALVYFEQTAICQAETDVSTEAPLDRASLSRLVEQVFGEGYRIVNGGE